MARPSKEQKKQKALLDAFGERYILIENNGGYCLYDKETPGHRSNFMFKGKFYLSSNSNQYVFNDNFFATIQELLEAMDSYYGSLPFSPEIYDPTYRVNVKIEFALHDYLHNLGFKMKWGGISKICIYELYDPYGDLVTSVGIETEMDKPTGSIHRYIGQYKWQEASFHDLDSAIGACNSILSGYFGIAQAQLMNCLQSLTHHRASEVYTHTFDLSSLRVYTEYSRQKTIEYLEAELKRLKDGI